MRLNVDFKRDRNGKETPHITDDLGREMPCIRAVALNYRFREATEVTITLVVNRREVTIGRAKRINPQKRARAR